ncbi:MAG: S8 family serine peptidase [Bacteroidota bacterium]
MIYFKYKYYLCFLCSLLLSCLSFTPTTFACNPVSDSLALVDLYNATNGANWTNTWDLNQPMSTWYGITLDGGRCVTRIDLDGDYTPGSFTWGNVLASGNNLVGTLPALDLPNLITITLAGNSLSGNLPTFSGMPNITILALYNNDFSGSLDSLKVLKDLLQISIYDNNFTGNVDFLEETKDLFRVFLNDNQLSGTLPTGIGGLSNLNLFYAFNNNLNGTLPAEIGDLTALERLRLENNSFSGALPNEIGNLSSLTFMDLSNNNFSGNLPSTLGNLKQLRDMRLSSNSFTGNIPTELSNIPNLEVLQLFTNQLSGSIPPQLGNLKKLRNLHLAENMLTGELPVELTFIDSLKFTSFRDNQLTGCYPAEYTYFCAPWITGANFTNNPGLGSFTDFCNDGTGVCSDNDECVDAIELPINLDPCGRDARLVALDGASTSGIGPFGTCNASFTSKDVWFKVVTPSTGNFLIRTHSNTNLRLYAEAYANCPTSAADTIKCGYLGESPNVFIIEDRMATEVIYIRIWDSLNVALNQADLGLAEISAHELEVSTNKAEWKLCDFPNTPEGTQGGGTRIANEIIVQFDPNTTPAERDALRQENGITEFEVCDCANSPLELWTTENPIDTETKRKKVAQSSQTRQDTTGYNYVINIIPLVDTLKEQIVHDDLAGNQINPQVAMDSAGNYVVVWEYEADIYARLFDVEGNSRGAVFRVNVATQDAQTQPKVSMNASGEFVVTWRDNRDNDFPSLSNGQVRVHRYDANGAFLSSVLVVDNTSFGTTNPFGLPDVTLADDGSFVVTHNTRNTLGMTTFYNVFWEKYDVNNVSITSGTIYPTLSYTNSGLRASIDGNGDGTFVIVWQEGSGNDGDGFGIYRQIRDSNGGIISTEETTLVNETTVGNQLNPNVAINDNGAFVATWTDINSGNIYARRYDNVGEPISGEFIVNNNTLEASNHASVATDESGDFIITWTERVASANPDVHAQYYDRNGVEIGAELRLNRQQSGVQINPDVAFNDEGKVAFVWESRSIDYDVIHKRYLSPASDKSLTDLINFTDTIGINKEDFDATYNPVNTVGDVIVAILDSGVDDQNTSLQNALWQYDDTNNCVNNNLDEIGYDFINGFGFPDDLDGHGTAVNGRIVTTFPNDLQLEMLNAKFYENGQSTLFDAVCAIYYAIEQGAKVLNLSWGFESAEFPRILQDALDYAACQDVIVITSAGNEGRNNDSRAKYPSNLSELDNNIISVTAFETNTSGQNSLSGYSNFGQEVDIAAPGFVETTGLDGETVTLSGTSLAAPAVSRVAAIIKARYPQLSALQIKDCILTTVDDYDFDIATGGTLNESAALACALDKSMMTFPTCESDKIQLNANVYEESCAGNDGVIDLLVSGTASEITLIWSDGFIGEDRIDLAADIYEVTATDECGCEKTLTVEVQNECNGGNCQVGRIINDNPIIGAIYRSFDSIESAGKVEAGTDVEFRAGQIIELKAGFHAKAGADFIAKIEGCTLSINDGIEGRSNSHSDQSMQLEVFPNPAASRTTIRYFLAKSEKVQIGLYDLNGRLLQRIAAQEGEVGWNNIDLLIEHLAAGIYFIRLQNADYQMIKKLVVGK